MGQKTNKPPTRKGDTGFQPVIPDKITGKMPVSRLPENWRQTRIGDAYCFTRRPKGLRYSDYATIPFIPMNLIPQGGATQPSFVDKTAAQITSGTYFEQGDLLLSKITPSFENGKQAIASNLPIPFGVATTEVIPIQALTGTSDTHFLFYCLLQPEVRQAIASKMEGSTGRQRVPEHVIRDWIIPLPPLAEQERIAAILWKIQEAIASEAAIIRNARDLKKSLLRHLFTHGLHNEPLKETEIGRMPESWDVVTIGHECGTCTSAMSYTQFIHLEESVEGVIVHGVKVSDMNLPGNEVRFESANLVKTLPLSIAQKRTVPSGSVVFPKRGAAIATNKKRLTTTWTVLDPNLIAIVPGKDVESTFLLNWFLTFDLASITEPGPTPQLNKKNVVPLLFPKPTKEEQREITPILSTVDENIAIHEANQQTLRDLFRAVLNGLMSGKMRVGELEMEEAR